MNASIRELRIHFSSIKLVDMKASIRELRIQFGSLKLSRT